jgi:hypothetical protein
MAVFFNDSAFFVFSIFIMCSTRFVLYYIPYKRKVFTFFKKGNNVLRKPVRPSLLYSFEKNQKKEKRTCSVWKHPLAWGENHVRYIPNVIWNSRWPRVANESTASHPPLLHFLFTPPTCILLLGPLTDFCGLKLHRIFFFTCNNSQKIFSLEINKKKNFDQPL